MEIFDSIAIVMLTIATVALRWSFLGGLVAGVFLLVAFSSSDERGMKAFLSHLAKALVFVGFLPVIAWLGVAYVWERDMPPVFMFWWGGGALLGLALFFVGGRLLTPAFDKLKHKVTKRSDLERNRKTDVREIHKFLPEQAVQFDPVRYFDLKRGIFLGLDEDKKPIFIQAPGGASIPHIQVVGTTGGGKGVSLGVMATQFLARGEAVFFMDPKNDEWAPHVLHQECKRLGVPFHFVDLRPGADAQLNPVADASADEIHELFIAAFALSERGDASDFYGIADRKAALQAARYIAEQHCTMAAAHGALHGELSAVAEKFDGKLGELAALASINARQGGVDLAQVVEQGGCVYVVGSMRHDTIKTVQRMLLVRLIQIAETRDRMAGAIRPVAIVLDELKYHISRPALEALGAARDKGVHVVLAHQSLGDLRDCPNDLDPDAVVDAVVENCRIKLAYCVINPDTAEWLSRMTGSILVDDEIRKIEKNVALVERVEGDRSIRQADRYLIDENMLLSLPRSVAVIFGNGLPRFVSIQPIKTTKSRDAITITRAEGDKAIQAADLIDVADGSPGGNKRADGNVYDRLDAMLQDESAGDSSPI